MSWAEKLCPIFRSASSGSSAGSTKDGPAPAGHLAITVARLDNDIGGARETLLRDELRHSMGVEVQQVDGTINLCESWQSPREPGRELAMDLAREDEIRLVKDEYDKFVSGYDHDSFVLNCKIRSRLLIEVHRDGARFIADEAIRALGCSKPLLMVRIGDAEANLLRFARHRDEFELKWVNAVFLMNDNQTLPIEDAKRLSRELSELLAGVDIIGLGAFGPNPSDVQIRKISQAIDRKNLRGALGMIEALQYGDRAVKNGEFRNTVLTSAWVHLGLLEHLDVVLDNAPRVVVITGRHELETLFSEKLKKRLAAFLSIPVQASDQSSPERPFHYPTRYKEIIAALRTDLRGTLVLAGAGIFGKKYCATARQNGAVALDLGSAFDILADKITRPVHSNPSVIDPNHGPWIKTKQA